MFEGADFLFAVERAACGVIENNLVSPDIHNLAEFYDKVHPLSVLVLTQMISYLAERVEETSPGVAGEAIEQAYSACVKKVGE